MKKFIKQLLCFHNDITFIKNLYGDSMFNDFNKSLWKCNKCGKEIIKDYIN